MSNLWRGLCMLTEGAWRARTAVGWFAITFATWSAAFVWPTLVVAGLWLLWLLLSLVWLMGRYDREWGSRPRGRGGGGP